MATRSSTARPASPHAPAGARRRRRRQTANAILAAVFSFIMAVSPLTGFAAEVAAQYAPSTTFIVVEADPAAPSDDPATGSVGETDPPQQGQTTTSADGGQPGTTTTAPSGSMSVVEEGAGDVQQPSPDQGTSQQQDAVGAPVEDSTPAGTTVTSPEASAPDEGTGDQAPTVQENGSVAISLGESDDGWVTVAVGGLSGPATVEVVAAGACDPIWTDELAASMPDAEASENGDGTSSVTFDVEGDGTWELPGVFANLPVSASVAALGGGKVYAEVDGPQADAASTFANGDTFDAYNRHIVDGNCPVISNVTSGGTALCADSRRAAPGTVTETGTWPAATFNVADPWSVTTRSGVTLGSVIRQLEYIVSNADYGSDAGIYTAQYATWYFTNPDRFPYGQYSHYNAEICAMIDAANDYASSGDQTYSGRCEVYVPQGNGSYYDTWLQYLVLYAPPQTGDLTIWKGSANPAITDGNSLYSLSGATYTVYNGPECRADQFVCDLTTGSTGGTVEANQAWLGGFNPGTYYVKETQASPGYKLDTTVYTIQIDPGEHEVLELYETPVADPPSALVQKLDAVTGGSEPQGAGELGGAEFTIRYYAGSYDANGLPSSATRTWVLRTDDNGFVRLQPDYLVSGDAFYTDLSGNFTLPLGTVTIQETKAPEGYLLDDTLYVTQVENASGTAVFNTRIIPERPVLGGISVVKQDGDGAPLSGAVFEIVNATGGIVSYDGETYADGKVVLELTTGSDGTASTGSRALPIGSYTVREKSAPEGYIAGDAEQTVTVSQDGVVAACASPFVNELARGGISLQKLDAQTSDGSAQGSATLAGAVFEIRDADGDVVATLTTDAAGRASTAADALPLGTYTVVETVAPQGYALPADKPDRTQTVTLSQPGQVAALASAYRDSVLRGGLSVQKADVETGSTAAQGSASFQGAIFEVVNANAKPIVYGGATYQSGEAVLTLTTDASGTASTAADALPVGTYTVTETRAPQGYLVNDTSWTVEVRSGEIVPVGDSATSSTALSNSTAETVQGASEGTSGPLDALASLFAPSVAMASEADGSGDATVAEQVVRGGIRVYKIDADTGLGDGQGDATLEGTEFSISTMNRNPVVVDGVTYEYGSVVMKIYTDENGMAQTGAYDLPYGTYAVAETGAPVGYLDIGQLVDVTQNGVIVTVGEEFENQVQRGGISVQKVDADLGRGQAQGSATLEGTVFEIVNASEDMVVVDGWYYDPGEVVMTLTTDESGFASTGSRALPYGTYTVREKSAPAGYLDGEEGYEQTVEIREDGVVVACEADFANEVQRGGIELYKVDADSGVAAPQGNGTLEGAVFEVANANSQPVYVDGTEYAPGEVVMTLTTDEFGHAASAERALPVGTYTVTETRAPQGYYLDSEPQTVTISDDGAFVALSRSYQDAVQRGGIELYKGDAAFAAEPGSIDDGIDEQAYRPGEASRPQGDATLAGVVYDVVNASANPVIVGGQSYSPGQTVMQLTTDANGYAATGDDVLPYGTYTVREVSAPSGYRLGLVDEDGTETGDGTEVTVSVGDGVKTVYTYSLSDDVVRGGLSVQKVDADLDEAQAQGSATLEGTVFEVVNASATDVLVNGELYAPGEVVLTLVTDASGFASTGSRDLPYGTYTVTEVAAPDGYNDGDGTSQTVLVREEGVVVACGESFANDVERGGFGLRKADAETGEASAQGDATLEGATFEVVSDNDQPVVVDGQTYGRGDVVMTIATDASGWAQVPGSSLPVGTYTVTEVASPSGYRLGQADDAGELEQTGISFTVTIESQGWWHSFEAGEISDQVVRGGLSLHKADAETADGTPQGAGTLEGAIFEVANASTNDVVVNGETYAPGEVVLTLTTDANGDASTGSRELPFGTYTVTEVSAPEGYHLDPGSQTVTVREEGATVACGGDFDDTVIRGGASVGKTDAETGGNTPQGSATFAGAVFEITNANAHAVIVNGESYLPGDVVARIVTGDDGTGSTASDALPYGTYTVRETAAPQGYLVNDSVWTITVSSEGQIAQIGSAGRSAGTAEADEPQAADEAAGASGGADGSPMAFLTSLFAPSTALAAEAGGNASDQGAAGDTTVPEQVVRGGVSAQKIDAETGEPSPQGGATLSGTRFAIVSMNEHPVVVNGASYSYGETVLVIESGEDGAAASGADALPYGTYEIYELEPPQGYLPGDDSLRQTFTVSEQAVVVGLTSTYANGVVRGGIAVQKVDDAAGEDAQGAATFEGAVFEVVNANDNPVLAGGQSYAPGEVVATLTTGADGHAQTASDLLPYGTYTVREASAPEGYVASAPQQSVTVSEQGVTVSTGSAFADRVVRGDFQLVKVRESDMTRLSGVPFLVTSTTTGESHVVVTDANGFIDTSASWNAHTSQTNANDAAVADNGDGTYTVDESMLDPSAGVWFAGLSEGGAEADDAFGALPYDTYTVTELPCSANEGLRIVSFQFTVARDLVKVDLGTVDNSPAPAIGTLFATVEDGSHQAYAEGQVDLVDTVAYAHFDPGTYTAVLEVVLDDGTPLTDAEGNPVTGNAEFTTEADSGEFQVSVTVDASELAGRSLVAYESVYDTEGNLVAEHKDLSDAGQTVSFEGMPEIATELTSEEGGKVVPAGETTILVDTVSYSGLLTDGRAYEITGTLYDKATGEPLADAEGNPVTATLSGFVPETPEGTVDLAFEVPGELLAGKAVVAFESLTYQGRELAVHADIEDASQTVWVPEIGTTLADAATGIHLAKPEGEVTLTDAVAYSGLKPGETYTLEMTLTDRETGEALTDAEGNPMTAAAEFTAEAAEGTAEVSVTVDASALAGRTLVAFESLVYEDREVAVHADLSDEAQTVRFPQVGTELATVDGSHAVLGEGAVDLVDTVAWSNLKAGEAYLLSATLWDAETGEQVTDAEGNPVTAGAEFTAEAEDGQTQVTFAGVEISDRRVVCFEDLSMATEAYEDGTHGGWVEIASHRDLSDTEQTVSFGTPMLRTTLTDDATGLHETPASEGAVLTDAVEYEGLTAGETYTLTGTLYDKQTGEALADVEGNPVASTSEFTAEEGGGTASTSFALDLSDLAGHTLVAFEAVTDAEGNPVAEHADLEDEAQSVRVVGIRTTATDAADGDHEAASSTETLLYDRVELTGVESGATYTIETELADAETRATIATSSAEVIPSRGDTAFTISATVDTTSLGGRDLVFLETLKRDGQTVAEHRDYSDVGQTVRISPWIATTLTDKATGYHETATGAQVTLVDTVEYHGLETLNVPYTLTGTLYDKASGGALADAEGNPVTATATFTPTASDGEETVEFAVDATDFADGTQVVCFEVLADANGRTVAEHADLEDAAQTVTFRAPTQPGSDAPTTPGSSSGTMPQTGQGIMWAVLIGVGVLALAAAALVLLRGRARIAAEGPAPEGGASEADAPALSAEEGADPQPSDGR